MKKTKFLLTTLAIILIGIFCISVIISDSKDAISQKRKTTTEKQIDTFTVFKGATYTKSFFNDENDPFLKPILDTVTVLDLQKSKKDENTIYVKFTFNKWKDTTQFISTELNYFSIGLKRIK